MWSDLCPDLLRSVFGLLSFTNLVRAKSVCKSWNSAWRSCAPKRNQIPWLILFPRKNQTNNNNNNSCVLFVPDDKDNLYRTLDLGDEFTGSCCVASYGSWLLMFNCQFRNLYIINPLTSERMDVPHSSRIPEDVTRRCIIACLWVDHITKKYLVVWNLRDRMVYNRKGDGRWITVTIFHSLEVKQIVYNCKDDKVYMTSHCSSRVFVWDFSDDTPKENGYLLPYDVARYANVVSYANFDPRRVFHLNHFNRVIATRVSGQVLLVTYMVQESTWHFCIFEYDPLTRTWEKVDDLGDEALILDMSFTVVAKDIPGMKRNSVYFSGIDHIKNEPGRIFVYDLGTRTTEHVPRCLVSSVSFSDARWFLPDITC